MHACTCGRLFTHVHVLYICTCTSPWMNKDMLHVWYTCTCTCPINFSIHKIPYNGLNLHVFKQRAAYNCTNSNIFGLLHCTYMYMHMHGISMHFTCTCVSSTLSPPPPTYALPQTLCHYTKQLLEALSYLHSQGIVHNDLRPSLVFLDGGGVKLGGFSIVKRYK